MIIEKCSDVVFENVVYSKGSYLFWNNSNSNCTSELSNFPSCAKISYKLLYSIYKIIRRYV